MGEKKMRISRYPAPNACTLYSNATGGFRARMRDDKKGAGAQNVDSNAKTKACAVACSRLTFGGSAAEWTILQKLLLWSCDKNDEMAIAWQPPRGHIPIDAMGQEGNRLQCL